jgi:hypothetical protein
VLLATCYLLISAIFGLGEVCVFQRIECLSVSVGSFQFHKTFQMEALINFYESDKTTQQSCTPEDGQLGHNM